LDVIERFFMRNVIFEIIEMALKGQHELSQINHVAPRKAPELFRLFELTARSGDAGAAVHCSRESDGTLIIRASQGERTYEVKVPTSAKTLAEFKVGIKLTEGTSTSETELTGEHFLNGTGIPDAYAELHKTVKPWAERYLGWLVKKPSAGATAASKATAPSSETAGGAAAEKEYRVHCSVGPDLKFTGTRKGVVRSVEHHGRAWQYSVYLTKGGNWVGIKEGLSCWLGEKARVDTIVVKDPRDLIGYFGHGPLAQALYADIGLDYVTHVD